MSALAKPIDHGPSSAASASDARGYGRAFWVSVALHGFTAAVLLVLALALKEEIEESPPIFELVAGVGDNFGATEAPAGSEAGRAAEGELRMPALPEVSTWTPPADAAPEPAAAEAVAVPNFAKNLKATLRAEQRKVDRELERQRVAAEKARAEAAKKKTSFDQFQRQQGVKTPPKAPTATGTRTETSTRIDAERIRQGVTGGVGAGNTGAGGTALSRAEGNAMEAYDAMLRARLLASHELPPGVSDLLSAEVVFTVAANGAISGARITRSSGSADYDRSVLEAFARVRMPPRPDGKTDAQRLTFRIREA
jgi:colicin import membrane protein